MAFGVCKCIREAIPSDDEEEELDAAELELDFFGLRMASISLATNGSGGVVTVSDASSTCSTPAVLSSTC